jgi:MYXO-CTERM domain-containing protein
VISFSDEVDPLFKSPQAMTKDNRESALDFIRRLHPTGGTDIALALKTAVAAQTPGSENPQVVVFLTDGQSDAAQASAVKTGNVRLFTLGLGRDVNKPLLSRLAAEKRGRFVFIENAQEIETKVDRLAANISKPLLVDVNVTVDGANATRMYPRTLPDLFAEDELRVSGRLRGTGSVKFKITGKLAGKQVEYVKTVDLGKEQPEPWTASLWAESRIDHLLEEIALDASKTEYKDEVLELSLAYNFLTPYTAFLAVPESELGAMHDTVTAARERKAKILANNQDVADLDEDKPDSVARNTRRRPDVDAKRVAQKDDLDDDAAPKMHKRMSHNSTKPVAAKDSDDDGDDAHNSVQAAPPETTAEDVNLTSAQSSGRHGCAGCAMTGQNGASSLVLVGLTILGLRRRRRK